MIVNLTPHLITVTSRGGPPRQFAPSGRIARGFEIATIAGDIEGVPTSIVEYAGVEDMPDPEPDVWLIVSISAAQAAAQSGRRTDDLLITGLKVRDPTGQFGDDEIGCESLAHYGGPHRWKVTTLAPPDRSGYYLATHVGETGHPLVSQLWFARDTGQWFAWRYIDQVGGCETSCPRRHTPIVALSWMRMPTPEPGAGR